MLTLDHFHPDMLIEKYRNKMGVFEALSCWPRSLGDEQLIDDFINDSEDVNEKENRLFIIHMFSLCYVPRDDIFAQSGVVEEAREFITSHLESLAIQDRERFKELARELLFFLRGNPEERKTFSGFIQALSVASGKMWETGILKRDAVDLPQPPTPAGFD